VDLSVKVGLVTNDDESPLIHQALDLYVNQNIDLIDAYHVFYLRAEFHSSHGGIPSTSPQLLR
jgi:hypothetical protein